SRLGRVVFDDARVYTWSPGRSDGRCRNFHNRKNSTSIRAGTRCVRGLPIHTLNCEELEVSAQMWKSGQRESSSRKPSSARRRVSLGAHDAPDSPSKSRYGETHSARVSADAVGRDRLKVGVDRLHRFELITKSGTESAAV